MRKRDITVVSAVMEAVSIIFAIAYIGFADILRSVLSRTAV